MGFMLRLAVPMLLCACDGHTQPNNTIPNNITVAMARTLNSENDNDMNDNDSPVQSLLLVSFV